MLAALLGPCVDGDNVLNGENTNKCTPRIYACMMKR